MRKRKGSSVIKAIFMDYTGTMVQESGEELKTVVGRICRHSDLREPKDVMGMWWRMVKEYEEASYGSDYLTEDEIVDRALQNMVDTIHLEENLGELHRLIQGFWVHAPLFSDVRPFLRRCPIPVYVISNNGIQYVEESLKEKKISTAGIVCADMVRAYKPHRELFERALEYSGRSADEVLHVGDSYQSDVQGARSTGIRPVLIQRGGGEAYKAVTTIRELPEVLDLLN